MFIIFCFEIIYIIGGYNMNDISIIKNILHEYLIKQKIFGNYRYGGSGSNGYIFILNDQAIKITTDNKEFKSAIFFKNKPHKNVVNYFDATWEDNIGFIRMELVKPLDPVEDRLLIKNWSELVNPNSAQMFGYKIDQYRSEILELQNCFNLNLMELHWGNCGFTDDNKLKFFDLKLNKVE